MLFWRQVIREMSSRDWLSISPTLIKNFNHKDLSQKLLIVDKIAAQDQTQRKKLRPYFLRLPLRVQALSIYHQNVSFVV